MKPAVLALADGTVFHGLSAGADGQTLGEVVFNTAMTGYQEILTDPSYCRQIVTLTYPHVGNTGTNSDDFESAQVFASGLIIRDRSIIASNWRSEQSLADFLRRANTVAIADIDTRHLTRHIREHGAQAGCIMTAREGIGPRAMAATAIVHARKFPGLSGVDLAKIVTTTDTYQWAQGDTWQTQDEVVTRRIAPIHVVFLSNGPGDPEPCDYAIAAIRELLSRRVPLFGICLGHQLLALATGARTEKMKFGHHGANHPVQELESGRVFITSQNHGFAVDEASLPDMGTPSSPIELP